MQCLIPTAEETLDMHLVCLEILSDLLSPLPARVCRNYEIVISTLGLIGFCIILIQTLLIIGLVHTAKKSEEGSKET